MINNGGMGNAMETKSLLEAFRSAGDVAFDCRHYLEWEQAKNKGETTQTESLFLLLSEFDDAEIAEGEDTHYPTNRIGCNDYQRLLRRGIQDLSALWKEMGETWG